MNERSARNFHSKLGITIALFLLIQVSAGLLLSLGSLLSATEAKWLQILGTIHAGWDPAGSVYRVFLGLAAVVQIILGILIFRFSRSRRKKSARGAR
jgi:hypothetical protein